ncbi:hypothetical protein PFAG_04971 [Plasmodium falciparum Santa Lucia]|uniref:Uncharacterized protein n=2 Tax=Plasmodium falciparum TaxID=5833 RepID=W7F2C9_PLAF8|nr:hypothetical protein PFBG_04935 [Plasmodium falciparum 7G8]EUT80330.1 hypothetical protein PFAG_04971 [Plasmodium falciparum Santa Lucia]
MNININTYVFIYLYLNLEKKRKKKKKKKTYTLKILLCKNFSSKVIFKDINDNVHIIYIDEEKSK